MFAFAVREMFKTRLKESREELITMFDEQKLSVNWVNQV